VDLNALVVLNAEVRSEVIPIAATRCVVIPNAAIQSVVDLGAMVAVQNAVILFAAQIVALNVVPNAVTRNAVTPNVVTQAATGDFPIEAVLNEAIQNVVQDVARDVVIQCAVTLFVRHVGDQCVADLDALVDSQDEDLPNDGQDVSPVGRLSPAAVQRADARDASLFSVPALS